MVSEVKKRWDLNEAKAVAESIVELLKPKCERIVVAGSIRRRRPDVGDIEVLAIPSITYTNDLFGEPTTEMNALDAYLKSLILGGPRREQVFDYRLSSNRRRTYGPLNKLLVHRPSGIPVDIFSTDAKNFGMALMVRTGPREWNIKFMKNFKDKGWEGHAYGGVTDGGGTELPCPEEDDVFKYLEWSWVPPESRY